jgi:hypothetical protein
MWSRYGGAVGLVSRFRPPEPGCYPVNAYGYSGVRQDFGPKLNSDTAATWSPAQGNAGTNVQTP